MKSSPAARRAETLKILADEKFDVLIIGGGIVGAGVARDAALRGLKVALIDRHDFAFGTSSRSSRLLHGGIRYLAQGRIGLVREASVEKTILHKIAPHLAEPLPFIFPAFRASSEWPFWQLRIGVKIYDLLCGGKNLGRSRSLNVAEVAKEVPQLERKGLAGAVRYFDGFTQDARLVIDTLRSAEKAGASLANYVRFLKSERNGGGFAAQCYDEISGSQFTIRSQTIVNATGPWSQQIPGSSVQLRLTKGIHLVFAREKLPVREAVVITEGSRVLFVLPWGERIILGTTDTDFTGPPESVQTKTEDVTYLLAAVRRFFPETDLVAGDVISAWSGLRPLIADPRGNPSDISRSHQIRQSQPGWWDVAGGKLTTYRLIAEQTVNQLAAALNRSFASCVTAHRALLPAEETKGISQVVPPEFSERLIGHFCKNEWALNFDDLLVRRTSWAFYAHPSRDTVIRCVEVMGDCLGWTTEQRQGEITRYFAGQAAIQPPTRQL